MPLTTRMFNWHDKEFKVADEIYVAVVAGLSILMVVGFFVLAF